MYLGNSSVLSNSWKMSIPKGNLNKPTGALVNLMKQLYNFTDDEKENKLNLPNWNIETEIRSQRSYQKFWREGFILFHVNVCSLTKNFDDFNILLSEYLHLALAFLQLQNLELRKICQVQLIFN